MTTHTRNPPLQKRLLGHHRRSGVSVTRATSVTRRVKPRKAVARGTEGGTARLPNGVSTAVVRSTPGASAKRVLQKRREMTWSQAGIERPRRKPRRPAMEKMVSRRLKRRARTMGGTVTASCEALTSAVPSRPQAPARRRSEGVAARSEVAECATSVFKALSATVLPTIGYPDSTLAAGESRMKSRTTRPATCVALVASLAAPRPQRRP
mmetsp:Transcript_17244/g.69380  ORF Transcript_17244/g.69380 Transcript_17244/m.69380 type:complete len:209 (-) Transcript_17244:1121-1747(-)